MKIRPEVEVSDSLEHCLNCDYMDDCGDYCELYCRVNSIDEDYEIIKCDQCKEDCIKATQEDTEQTILKLRAALLGLIESDDDVDELKGLMAGIVTLPIPDEIKANTIAGIRALLETQEYKGKG